MNIDFSLGFATGVIFGGLLAYLVGWMRGWNAGMAETTEAYLRDDKETQKAISDLIVSKIMEQQKKGESK
jgi:hypothetical protein